MRQIDATKAMDPKHIEQFSRRGFVQRFGTAMAGVSLSGIFPGDKVFAAPASALADYTNPLKPRKAHFPTKAKACIYRTVCNVTGQKALETALWPMG